MAATLTLAERKAIEDTIRERWAVITTIYDVQVGADQGSRAYLRTATQLNKWAGRLVRYVAEDEHESWENACSEAFELMQDHILQWAVETECARAIAVKGAAA